MPTCEPNDHVVQADTLDEAIGIVNGNEHGNGTALFTRSGPAARKFQNEVEVGVLHQLLKRLSLRYGGPTAHHHAW